MIYSAMQRAATFGETLARFRPALSLLAKLEAINDDEPLEDALAGAVDPKDIRRGLIAADWRFRRRVGHTVLHPALRFVDVTDAGTMQHLRTALAPLAARLQLTVVDLGG